MGELRDYSGRFGPDLTCADFSQDVLVKLLRLYAQLYYRLDGFWYMSVKEKITHADALACDMWVWERQTWQEMSRLARLLKIDGGGVVRAMKALQVSPWAFSHRFHVEFKDENDAVLTFTYCPTLEALEREGQGREENICRIVDPVVKRRFAAFFDPAIEVIPLSLPPRHGTDQICCQWEFRLERAD